MSLCAWTASAPKASSNADERRGEPAARANVALRAPWLILNVSQEMTARIGLLCLAIGLLEVGCASTQSKIESARRQFVSDPTTGRYGYDGTLVSGHSYAFLCREDPHFGDFLSTIVPSATDPKIAAAALTYFAWTKPDRVRFEALAEAIPNDLLSQKVSYGGTDVISVVTLAVWIELTREEKKWANQVPEPTSGLAPGRGSS
jgi:hypothetical protein